MQSFVGGDAFNNLSYNNEGKNRHYKPFIDKYNVSKENIVFILLFTVRCSCTVRYLEKPLFLKMLSSQMLYSLKKT